MSDNSERNISTIHFSSTVYPTKQDLELWSRLNPEEKQSVILRELNKARESGLAPKQNMAEIIIHS